MEIFPVKAFKDNYIWVFMDDLKKQAVVVDPGDAAPVIAELEKQKLELSTILLTHHHADHSGGVVDLKKRWEDVSVIASEMSLCHFVTHRVKEGDRVLSGAFELQVLDIPGHTLDHVAYFNESVLFCGDTLFSAGCGRVFEGTYAQMYDSLRKLLLLADETKIYCGHGYTLANLEFAKKVEPLNLAIEAMLIVTEKNLANKIPTLPSILSVEKQINPFLRCTVPAVIQAARAHAGKKLMTPVDVFTRLREWKNSSAS